MLDHQYFKKVGTKVRDKYRTHIFTKAKDVYGSKFKGYKEPYKTLKQSGKLKRQSGSSAGTTAPIVTTDLLRDFGTVYKTSSTKIIFLLLTSKSSDIPLADFLAAFITIGLASSPISLTKSNRMLSLISASLLPLDAVFNISSLVFILL